MTGFDIKGKRVYLSGPMTGIPNLNAPAFRSAQIVCRLLGADEVFNPATAWGHASKPHQWYMRHDLHRLTQSEGDVPHFDAIVMLDGWEGSGGALLERSIAEACGIEVVTIAELKMQLEVAK